MLGRADYFGAPGAGSGLVGGTTGLSPPGEPSLPGFSGVLGAAGGSGRSAVGLPGSVWVGDPGLSPGDPGFGGSGDSARAPTARTKAATEEMTLIVILDFITTASSRVGRREGVFDLKKAIFSDLPSKGDRRSRLRPVQEAVVDIVQRPDRDQFLMVLERLKQSTGPEQEVRPNYSAPTLRSPISYSMVNITVVLPSFTGSERATPEIERQRRTILVQLKGTLKNGLVFFFVVFLTPKETVAKPGLLEHPRCISPE